jgi:hypothetical protein
MRLPLDPPSYSVEFQETGLPTGTQWSVTFNGTNSASTGTSISFSVPNGTFNFTVPHLLGLYPSPATGSLTVSGGTVVQNISWSPAPEYNVTITETGLPTGTQWVFVLAGTHHDSFGSVIVVPQGTGTYNWSVIPVASPGADGRAGWAAEAFAGVLKVSGGPAWINVTFVQGWAVTISEIGLPLGTHWVTDLNGTLRGSVNTQIVYILPNATYTFLFVSPVPGAAGIRYLPNPHNVSVKLAGTNQTTTVTYHPQYFLTVSASPSVGGTVSPASEWLNASAPVGLGETPARFYTFLSWAGSGLGNYSGNSTSPTITVNGPIEEIAVFEGFFPVNFTETGLPAGTNWSVTLNNQLAWSTTATISFVEPNGAYNFAVSIVSGYTTPKASGTVTVSGAPVGVSLGWSPVGYVLTFTESGLPAGTNWSVTVASVLRFSTTSSITFNEPNGTYSYAIGGVPGYTTSPRTGSKTIEGASVLVNVPFSVTTYTVSFTESGLPGGTSWSVTVAGGLKSASTSIISFTEANGTFSYTVAGVTGYTASPSSGTVTVYGTDRNVAVQFSAVVYPVLFVETGLPSGTVWSVVLNGTTNSSSTLTLGFLVPNGTYPFKVAPIPGYSTTHQGSVVVAGHAITQNVSWTVFTLVVTFTESGLPNRTTWGVTFGGQVHTSATNTITINEPNGSYGFSVGNVTGYSASPVRGTLNVTGSAVSQAIAFSAVASAGSGGISTTDWILIVVAVVVVAAGLLAVVLTRRRRRPPAKSATPPR